MSKKLIKFLIIVVMVTTMIIIKVIKTESAQHGNFKRINTILMTE